MFNQEGSRAEDTLSGGTENLRLPRLSPADGGMPDSIDSTPAGPFAHPVVMKARAAAEAHFEGTYRKSPFVDMPPVPYFNHVQRVAEILAECGYDHEVVAAGYLHDHLEDLPELWNAGRLTSEFGARVTALVDWVTQQDKSLPWQDRVDNYFERLRSAPVEAMALSAADKISNIEDSCTLMKLGVPLNSFLKRGWEPNSAKFHELGALYRRHIDDNLYSRFEAALALFDKLGKDLLPLETGYRKPAPHPDAPAIIEVPDWLKAELPAIQKRLAEIDGDFAKTEVQQQVRASLMAIPAWSRWISENQLAPAPRPTLLRAGLETERDDEIARRMLVGIALCLQPDSYVPPYAIGGTAVTEVMAEAHSTPESHSKNDLPAPPHSAGFFEAVPPQTCYFSCIRPHAGGGAETTVLNLEKVLARALQAMIDEWSTKTYYLKTSKRLGEDVRPFQLLSWIDNVPFLRYRKEYTVGFEQDPSLKLLEELVTNPANQFIVHLQRGETLIHSNGAPHARLPQHGTTPEEVDQRRKLIRCRTAPLRGWEENF